jgi:hypothetical protein
MRIIAFAASEIACRAHASLPQHDEYADHFNRIGHANRELNLI